ncbi:hypothetical protein RCOM_2138330 [Ricinus communis]|uniref:Uncharacterized protein n=1 Tax=Ricinus communis TaxID=3988 RepID=B9T955_RICCO|nr:hypothetical protein RCOM_2138330 [Ricinus communis]
MVWVRFPELPVFYYDDDLLQVIASCLGTFIKIDRKTAMATRGRFARVCIEIDLSKPGRFWLDNHWYHIEYEGLHTILVSLGISQRCAHTRVQSRLTHRLQIRGWRLRLQKQKVRKLGFHEILGAQIWELIPEWVLG